MTTSSSAFWDEYKKSLRTQFSVGVTLPPNSTIFARPFTVPFVTANTPTVIEHTPEGDLPQLTPEGVAGILFDLANALLSEDGSPKKGEGYIQELNKYLQAVDEAHLVDPGAKQAYEAADGEYQRQLEKFKKVEADAKKAYAEYPGPPPDWDQWLSEDYPQYGTAKEALDTAEGKKQTAWNKYRGEADRLDAAKENIDKALDEKKRQASLNMPVPGGTFKPSYTSSYELREQLNEWLRKVKDPKVGRQIFCDVKIDSGTPPPVPSSPGKEGIYLTLSVRGVENIQVQGGAWDLPGVKTLYPKLKGGSPTNLLNPKDSRIIRYVVAFDPKLAVEIRDKDGKVISGGGLQESSDGAKPHSTILGVLGQHFPAN